MTLEVERDALLGALKQVADVVPGRTTIPVLANLMLVAEAGTLTVTSTDLDIEASVTIEAAGEIATTIDKNKLVAAVNSLKPGRLTITPVDGRAAAVTIKSGRAVRTLSTLPASDFPKRKPPEVATTFVLGGPVLARLLDACHVAQSTDETRYYLMGVYLHLVDGHLRAAAADGFRLVRAEVPMPPAAEGMPQVIVPTKAVTLLRKLIGKGEVTLSVSENAIQAVTGRVQVIAKVVDGTFPDYQRIIPDEAAGTNQLIGGRDTLLSAAMGVAAVVDAEGDRKLRSIRMDLTPGLETQKVSARDSAGSSADEEIEARAIGSTLALGMDHRLFTTTLGIFAEGAEMTMSFADPSAAVRAVSDKDPDLIAVIMPMRV
ncbi:DNA polymerase III subunit beta [Sphingomonas adhaesiva]|uniref:DNA polymerase III subunit beta n=1 Tax=Sphingomonas adhaesiva TaxID=28212 RepID=UPI002FF7C019